MNDDKTAAAMLTVEILRRMNPSPDAQVAREAAALFKRMLRAVKVAGEDSELDPAARRERRLQRLAARSQPDGGQETGGDEAFKFPA